MNTENQFYYVVHKISFMTNLCIKLVFMTWGIPKSLEVKIVVFNKLLKKTKF